jgi:hypothetical protein
MTDACDADWDNVLFYEETAFEEGKTAGIEAAKEVYVEGFEVGLAKGYSMGFELGFIDSNVRRALDRHTRGEAVISERMKNRLDLIVKRCDALPSDSTADVDHVVLLDEVKALYKSAGLPVFNKTGTFARGVTEEW